MNRENDAPEASVRWSALHEGISEGSELLGEELAVHLDLEFDESRGQSAAENEVVNRDLNRGRTIPMADGLEQRVGGSRSVQKANFYQFRVAKRSFVRLLHYGSRDHQIRLVA